MPRAAWYSWPPPGIIAGRADRGDLGGLVVAIATICHQDLRPLRGGRRARGHRQAVARAVSSAVKSVVASAGGFARCHATDSATRVAGSTGCQPSTAVARLAAKHELLRHRLGDPHVVGQRGVGHGHQLGRAAGGGQDLLRPAPYAAGGRLVDVEHLARGERVADRGEHGRGDVGDVAPAPQERAGPDRDPVPAGPDPAQDELLPALVVVLPVDHRQPQHRATSVQIGRFHVELLVADVVAPRLAVREAGRPYRRSLGEGQRLTLAGVEHMPERLVNVHTGQKDQLDIRQVGQDGVGVGPGHAQRVDDRGRLERPHLVGDRRVVGPGRVDVPAQRQIRRFGGAAVDDQHLVAASHQIRHDPPSDEPGPAEHGYPHAATPTGRPRSGQPRSQRA